MVTIYKNFADGFKHLNCSTVGERTSLVEGRRAYLIENNPYFSNIHFAPVSESYITHEILQKHFKKSTELQNRIWAGTAGEVNLSYMAVSKAPAAILFDINPFQALFWERFFGVMAETPDSQIFARNSEKLIKDVYFDLKDKFNLEALKEDNRSLDMKSPNREDALAGAKGKIGGWFAKFRDVEEFQSPIRNMQYKNFYNKIRTYLGWENTGAHSCADKDVQWIANEENYHHLYLMAKNNAIAAVTVDISDKPSCEQLKACLDNVEYDLVDETSNDYKCGRGAKIGNIYLSNILYYMNYTNDEKILSKAYNGKLKDFAGNEVSDETYKITLENLKSLVSPDAAIMRFDTENREGFRPLFSYTKESVRIPKPNDICGLSFSY